MSAWPVSRLAPQSRTGDNQWCFSSHSPSLFLALKSFFLLSEALKKKQKTLCPFCSVTD